MGNISELYTDLLVKILLLAPTKDVVTTSLLSKRWRHVWKLVPKLEYDDSYNSTATTSLFIDKFVQLNTAPFLETLYLRLEPNYAPEDYKKWVNVAVARNVRHVELLRNRPYLSPLPLPIILYTHETLVVLRLLQALNEDVPSTAFFRCLKTLFLLNVIFSSDETVDRFMSCCRVLETLDVHRWVCKKVKTFAICVPSLQRLQIESAVGGYQDARVDHRFLINAPSIKSLEIIDSYLKCEFDQLVSLELCVMCSLNLLNLILIHSPKLRLLRFKILVSFYPKPNDVASSIYNPV